MVSRGIGPGNDVAADQQEVDFRLLDFVENCLECGQIRVNVVQCRDPHEFLSARWRARMSSRFLSRESARGHGCAQVNR